MNWFRSAVSPAGRIRVFPGFSSLFEPFSKEGLMNFRSGLFAAVLIGLGVSSASAQTRVVTGKVVDSLTGEVITSGQVSVVGTAVGTTIKEDGTFTLAAPQRDVYVTIRSIGFKRRDVSVPVGTNAVAASLERDYFQLEAIVVTGQATGVERRNLANAVASISAEQMTKVPTASVERALQGKVTGATITDNNGAPGGGGIVRMRGVTSLIGAFTPLYVLNGVIVSDAAISRGTNKVTAAGGGGIGQATDDESNSVNRIADLNPNDIESVEVLKGAAASAIYGSKASNGVIIVTTKRGRVGTPQFSLSQKMGVSQISRKVGLRDFSHDSVGAVEGKGASVGPFWHPQFFDHEEELYGREPVSYETDASVNGGTETTRYFASGLVKHDGGIVNHTYYDKQSIRLNLDQNIGSRFTFGAGAQVIHSVAARGLFNNDNSGTSYGMIIPHTPSYIDLRATCPDGTRQVECAGGVYPQNPFVASNPLQEAALLQYTEGTWRSILSGNAALDLIKSSSQSLKLVGNGGADYFMQNDYLYSPPELFYED